jgi:hypothetical protein
VEAQVKVSFFLRASKTLLNSLLSGRLSSRLPLRSWRMRSYHRPPPYQSASPCQSSSPDQELAYPCRCPRPPCRSRRYQAPQSAPPTPLGQHASSPSIAVARPSPKCRRGSEVDAKLPPLTTSPNPTQWFVFLSTFRSNDEDGFCGESVSSRISRARELSADLSAFTRRLTELAQTLGCNAPDQRESLNQMLQSTPRVQALPI